LVRISAIDIIVAADIEKNDFLLGDQQRQGDFVATSQADAKATTEFSSEGV